jgi:hypothetical protein
VSVGIGRKPVPIAGAGEGRNRAPAVGVLHRMNATFLHADKTVSPDEQADLHPPACPACGATMWLVHVNRSSGDDGQREIRSYECKRCGAVKDVIDTAPLEARR